jgi:hypothetical protein
MFGGPSRPFAGFLVTARKTERGGAYDCFTENEGAAAPFAG